MRNILFCLLFTVTLTAFSQKNTSFPVSSAEVVLVDNADHYIYARLADDNLYLILEDLRDPKQTWEDNLLVFIDKDQNNRIDDHVDMIWNRKLYNTGIFPSATDLHTYYLNKYSGLGEQRQETFSSSSKLTKPHLIYTLIMPLWSFVEVSKLKIQLTFLLKRIVPEEYEFDRLTLEPTGLKTAEFTYPDQQTAKAGMVNAFILDFSKSNHASVKSFKDKNIDRLFSEKNISQRISVTTAQASSTFQENLTFSKSTEYDGVYIQKNPTTFAKIKGEIKHYVEYGHSRSGNSRMIDIIYHFSPQRVNSIQKILITGEEHSLDEVKGIKAFKLLAANDAMGNYFARENGGISKGNFYKLGEEVTISKSRNRNNQYEILFQNPFVVDQNYVLVVGTTWYPFTVLTATSDSPLSTGSSSPAQSVHVRFSTGKEKLLKPVKARIGAFGRVRSDGSGYDKLTSGMYYYMPEWFTEEKCARIKRRLWRVLFLRAYLIIKN